MDNLLTTLHVLVKEGDVVKHKTFAYARNQRERRGCYKLANQKVIIMLIKISVIYNMKNQMKALFGITIKVACKMRNISVFNTMVIRFET